MKKKTISILLSGVLAISLTACGSKPNIQQDIPIEHESTSSSYVESTVASTDASTVESTVEDPAYAYMKEMIVSDYSAMRNGTFSHEEFLEGVESYWGISVEEALEMCAQEAQTTGIEVETVDEFYAALDSEYSNGGSSYSASDEIKSSACLDPIIQIGNSVITLPVTLGDLLTQTNGKIITKSEATANDRAISEFISDTGINQMGTVFTTIDAVGDDGETYVLTEDGSYLCLVVGGRGEAGIKPIKDLPVSQLVTGSSNVFLAGNLHSGLSMDEISAIVTPAVREPYLSDGWTDVNNHIEISICGEFRKYVNSRGMNSILRIRVDRNTNKLNYLNIDFCYLINQ